MEIVKEPDKILHNKLNQVKAITPEVLALISEMKRVMKEQNGVGLAANQVGSNLTIFVIAGELAQKNNAPSVYINPEIIERSEDLGILEEGCLSLPGQWLNIPRAKKIKIKALDQNGKKIRLKARGFLARVLQHEIDHLQGILIKDRVQ